MDEIKALSDCPGTLKDAKIGYLEKVTGEELQNKRIEYNKIREKLIKQWEQMNGTEWPRYEHDIYSKSGKLIRQKGQYYDAHHIKPLTFGGKNVAENITPLHANVHFDSQGIHSPNGNYHLLNEKLQGGK